MRALLFLTRLKVIAVPVIVFLFSSLSYAGQPAAKIQNTKISPVIPQQAGKEEKVPPYVPDEVLIRVKEGVDPGKIFKSSKNKLSKISKFESIHSKKTVAEKFKKKNKSASNLSEDALFDQAYKAMDYLEKGLYRKYKIKLPKDVTVQEAVDLLKKEPGVEGAFPNYLRKTLTTPNDPRFSEQWALPKIHAPEAWDVGEGGGVVVAVVDTGVDYVHEDLMNNIWLNPGEFSPAVDDNSDGMITFSELVANGLADTNHDGNVNLKDLFGSSFANGVDDDGNGFPDDFFGYDFVSASSVYTGEDPAPRDDNPMDFNGHGSHCSGIIAAIKNNGKGISGVAPQARIMAVRAGYTEPTGYGILQDADIELALKYAVDMKAQVISMSFGGPQSGVWGDEIAYAYSRGVTLVAAAGNDSSNEESYPAAYPGVISVAASNSNDELAYFSNYGDWVTITAPGEEIMSTIPNNQYDAWSGTSMATPYVAGVAALVLSQHPTFTGSDVESVLRNSMDGLFPLPGGGRVNAQRAIQARGIYKVDLLSPGDGASYHANGPSIMVRGSAAGVDFQSYSVSYSRVDSPTEQIIRQSTTPVEKGQLAIWDISSLSPGAYILKLTVRGPDSDFIERVTVVNILQSRTRKIDGAQTASLAVDGRYAVWTDNGDVYLYDLYLERKTQLNAGRPYADIAAITGNYVAWNEYNCPWLCVGYNFIVYDITEGAIIHNQALGVPIQSLKAKEGKVLRETNGWGSFLYDIAEDKNVGLGIYLSPDGFNDFEGNTFVIGKVNNEPGLHVSLYMEDIESGAESRIFPLDSQNMAIPRISDGIMLFSIWGDSPPNLKIVDLNAPSSVSTITDAATPLYALSHGYIAYEDESSTLVGKQLFLKYPDGENQRLYVTFSGINAIALRDNHLLWSDHNGIFVDSIGGSIRINDDDSVTSSRNVTLELSADDPEFGPRIMATSMRFSNDGLTWSAAEPFLPTKMYTLTPGDGYKVVYAQFKDGQGAWSPVYTDRIFLNEAGMPPGISGGSPSGVLSYDTTEVTLSVTTEFDAVCKYALSPSVAYADMPNRFSFTGQIEHAETVTVSFGNRYNYYVRCQDAVGNTNLQDYVISFDVGSTVAPTGSIWINSYFCSECHPWEPDYLKQSIVNLTLSAIDSGAGMDQMRFSNDNITWSVWQPYATRFNSWSLAWPGSTTPDGLKTVYVQYVDRAGNMSEPISDTTTLDTIPPTGSILINGGAATTNSLDVTLSLSATDSYNLYVVYLSNDAINWVGRYYVDVSPTYTWRLAPGVGEKTVFIKYCDGIMNCSPPYSANITMLTDQTSPTGTISINGGAQTIDSRNVLLNLTASDPSGNLQNMRFSNDNTNWSTWEPFNPGKEWLLSFGNGLKTVYVQFNDTEGNISASFFDTIILDAAMSMAINGDAVYTNSVNVTLTMAVMDPNMAVSMRFSNDGVSWSAAEPYATTKAWTLVNPFPSGPKPVYVQFRNQAGNWSATISDNIILDQFGPSGQIVNCVSSLSYCWTNSVNVSLQFNVGDPSGISQMKVSNTSPANWSSVPAEPFVNPKPWALIPGEGLKTVYVHLTDGAGNASVISRSFTLDTTAPINPSVVINAGAISVGTPNVTLTYSAYEPSFGPATVRFSNDGTTWSLPEDYSFTHTKVWTLSEGDGIKTVYAQFADVSGNWSASASDTIILDTLPPMGSLLINNGAQFTGSANVTLNITAADAGLGMAGAQMRFSNDNTTWSTWENYATTKVWTVPSGEGEKSVFVQFKDSLAHASGSFSDKIILDISPPSGLLTINNGAETTTSTAVTLNLAAADAGSGMGPGAQMKFSNDNTTWSVPEDYAESKNWTLSTGDGTKTVYARFADASGNWMTTSISTTIILDATLPVTSVSGLDNLWHRAPVTVTLSATDSGGSGLDKTFYSTDGSNPSIVYTAPVTLSNDGTYTVKFYSRDKAGNSEAIKTAPYQVKIDKAKPTTTSSLGSSTATTITLNASTTDPAPSSKIDKIIYTIRQSSINTSLNSMLYSGSLTVTKPAGSDLTTFSTSTDVAKSWFGAAGVVYTVTGYDNAGNAAYSAKYWYDKANGILKDPDTAAPNVPAGLTVSNGVTAGTANLAWDASPDNPLPTNENNEYVNYEIYRNGVLIKSTARILRTAGQRVTYTDTNLVSGTQYKYEVLARDMWSNKSAKGTAFNFTLDPLAPTVPTGLQANQYGYAYSDGYRAQLSWGASTVSNGAVSYEIYRNDVKVSTTTSTTFMDTGLAETTYQYKVRAVANTNHYSGFSNTASVTLVN